MDIAIRSVKSHDLERGKDLSSLRAASREMARGCADPDPAVRRCRRVRDAR